MHVNNFALLHNWTSVQSGIDPNFVIIFFFNSNLKHFPGYFSGFKIAINLPELLTNELWSPNLNLSYWLIATVEKKNYPMQPDTSKKKGSILLRFIIKHT